MVTCGSGSHSHGHGGGADFCSASCNVGNSVVSSERSDPIDERVCRRSSVDRAIVGARDLQRFVRENYPRLSPDAFGYTAVSDTQIDFWYSENKAVRAIATAQEFDGKWFLTRFEACNSTLVAAGGGQ